MNARNVVSIKVRLAALVALAACGHDADRNHPLDPQLTPAVVLTAEADSLAGAVVLRWTAYAGQQPFAAYIVERNVADRVGSIVLDTLWSVDETSYLDTSAVPEVTYAYRVVTLGAGGLPVPSESRVVRLPSLAPVQIESLSFDSRSASAALRWSGYEGGDFTGYRVLRAAPGQAPLVVAEIADGARTTWADSGLTGNTEYSYRVDVHRNDGPPLASAPRSGSLHTLDQVWPLDLPEGSFVRLYADGGEGISALLSAPWVDDRRPGAFELRSYDASGNVTGLQSPFATFPFSDRQTLKSFAAGAGATARGDDGRRYWAYASQSDFRNLVVFVTDGGPQEWIDRQPFAADLPTLPAARSRVAGQISIWIQDGSNRTWTANGGQWSVAMNEQPVLEGFFLGFVASPPPHEAWQFSPDRCTAPVRNNLDCETKEDLPEPELFAQMADPAWSDFVFEFELELTADDVFGVQVGSETDGTSRLRLTLDPLSQEAVLEWSYRDGGVDETQRFAAPLPIAPRLDYRLRLGVVEGRVEASVSTWFLWSRQLLELPAWTSLVAADGAVSLAVDDERYDLSTSGDLLQQRRFEPPIGEARVWETVDGQRMLGIVHPEDGVVFARPVERSRSGRLGWPAQGAQSYGDGFGDGDGQLRVPISFDVGPDGRVYVLDADNARVQVFAPDGAFLTQWGTEGDGPGQFAFRLDASTRAGSIAVDRDGFIYVADVGNSRIQKFEP